MLQLILFIKWTQANSSELYQPVLKYFLKNRWYLIPKMNSLWAHELLTFQAHQWRPGLTTAKLIDISNKQYGSNQQYDIFLLMWWKDVRTKIWLSGWRRTKNKIQWEFLKFEAIIGLYVRICSSIFSPHNFTCIFEVGPVNKIYVKCFWIFLPLKEQKIITCIERKDKKTKQF